jgi:subtilisin family serine protease
VKLLSLILISTAFISGSASAASLSEFNSKNWALGSSAAKVQKAWSITQGSKNVVVAVIDTGIDAHHPDLKANLWKAPLKSSTYGWDFVTRSANPTDVHGHGTHIAGIIGAIANPKTGTAGVAQNVQIMPIRYYSEAAPGSVNLANTIKALHFAIDNGARIINYSGGGPEYSEEEFQAMKKAQEKGVLIVAAAGNEHNNTDLEENRYYPAAYEHKGLKNIISVASIDSEGKLLPSSNYGVKSVDIAAPGEGILSTIPGGKYGKLTGTSQATAFVTGVAALILSKQPNLSPSQIKEVIMNSASLSQNLRGKVAASGSLDALKAVSAVTTPARKMASR